MLKLILFASSIWMIIGLSHRIYSGHWSLWALYVFVAGSICVVCIKASDYFKKQEG